MKKIKILLIIDKIKNKVFDISEKEKEKSYFKKIYNYFTDNKEESYNKNIIKELEGWEGKSYF